MRPITMSHPYSRTSLDKYRTKATNYSKCSKSGNLDSISTSRFSS